MSADIEPLNGRWSPEAAAADALNRVNPTDRFVAIWIDEGGHIHFSKSQMRAVEMALFGAVLERWATDWVLKGESG